MIQQRCHNNGTYLSEGVIIIGHQRFWVDISEVPLERFTFQLRTQLLPFCYVTERRLPYSCKRTSTQSISLVECNFCFDLHFSFSFSVIFQFQFRFSLAVFFRVGFSFASYYNIEPADKDVLMICLNTIHRQSRMQRPNAVL